MNLGDDGLHATPIPGASSPATSRRQPPSGSTHYLPKLRCISQQHPTPPSPQSRPHTRASPSPSSGGGGDGLGCNEQIADEADHEDENDDDEEDEEEEEEAECSAPHCKKPIADQISWVQCDLCQEWFHCTCVGLTKEYAEKIDRYNCKKCLAAKSSGGCGQADGGVVSGGSGGGGVRNRTVQPAGKAQSVSVAGGGGGGNTGSSVSSKVAAAVSNQNLMKGLLQNPQLAARLLSNLPLPK